MPGGIFSGDDYKAAVKQPISMFSAASRATVAGSTFSVSDLAGVPGAGVLAAGNTANGIVPIDTDPLYPVINNFVAGAVGELTGVDYSSTVACRIDLYDRLFVAGEYNFNDVINLAAQPSFASRVPSLDYKQCELWIETTAAFTGIPTFTLTYTDEGATAGRSTGAFSAGAALTLGRCLRMPLAAGDSGLQKLESVSCTVATAGKFNVMILRRLWGGRVKSVADGGSLDLISVKPKRVYQNSALYRLVTPDSTASGMPSLDLEISNY